MEYKQKKLIRDYLNLDKRIKRHQRILEEVQVKFRNTNHHGRTSFDSNEGISFRGFRVDARVASYVDYTNTIEERLKQLEQKQRYFHCYLRTMDQHTRDSVMNRYNVERNDVRGIVDLGSDEGIYEEILEIEEAIAHEFKADVPLETNKNAIELENAELTNKTAADSFDTMAELLGV